MYPLQYINREIINQPNLSIIQITNAVNQYKPRQLREPRTKQASREFKDVLYSTVHCGIARRNKKGRRRRHRMRLSSSSAIFWPLRGTRWCTLGVRLRAIPTNVQPSQNERRTNGSACRRGNASTYPNL